MTKKEAMVYIIDCDECDDFRDWEMKGENEKIMEKAEQLGTVYSLQGFQNAVNDQELTLDNSFILIN